MTIPHGRMPDTPNASRVEAAELALIDAEEGWAERKNGEEREKGEKLLVARSAFAAAVRAETIKQVRERVEAIEWDYTWPEETRRRILAALSDLAEGK